MSSQDFSEWIKREALALGFDGCGIAPAQMIDGDSRANFHRWIGLKHHASMLYMERNIEKRCDPTLLVDGAQSVISVALCYAPNREFIRAGFPISSHALGADYHRLIKDKLYHLLHLIRQKHGEGVGGRVFVDSAPVLERYWAWRAGLGWIGKSNMLIIPNKGSYMFLGELMLTIALSYDTPMDNRCGECSRCVDSCPTGALESPYSLDSNRCISYHTIESKLPIPDSMTSLLRGRIYGCDCCLEACPHNINTAPTREPLLRPNDSLLSMQPSDWLQLTSKEFAKLFGGSSIDRIGFEKLQSNIGAAIERG